MSQRSNLPVTYCLTFIVQQFCAELVRESDIHWEFGVVIIEVPKTMSDAQQRHIPTISVSKWQTKSAFKQTVHKHKVAFNLQK